MRATSQASSNGIDAAAAAGGRLGPHSSGMTRARRCGRPWRASRASLVGHGHEANGLLLRADLLRRARPRFRAGNLLRIGRLPSWGAGLAMFTVDLRGSCHLRPDRPTPPGVPSLFDKQPALLLLVPFGAGLAAFWSTCQDRAHLFRAGQLRRRRFRLPASRAPCVGAAVFTGNGGSSGKCGVSRRTARA